MRKTVVVFLFAATGLHCGDSNRPSAYQEGSMNCSEQFVSDYNAIADSLRGYSMTLAELDAAENKVNAFESNYADANCRAKLLKWGRYGGEEGSVNVKEKVRIWRNAIHSTRSEIAEKSKPKNTTPPEKPSEVNKPIRAIEKPQEFDIEILDLEALNKSKDADGQGFLLRSNGAYGCHFSSSPDRSFASGEKVRMAVQNIENFKNFRGDARTAFFAGSLDSTLGLFCMRLDGGTQPLTISDVNMMYPGVVHASSVQ